MVVRKLAEDGADVVGVDISPRRLKAAPRLEASERLGITYVEADATAPGLLEEDVFDAVAGSDWANERPGTAGTPVYLVVPALRPPSPSVQLP
jgi:nucleoside-diphosphate-sugar epimerase